MENLDGETYRGFEFSVCQFLRRNNVDRVFRSLHVSDRHLEESRARLSPISLPSPCINLYKLFSLWLCYDVFPFSQSFLAFPADAPLIRSISIWNNVN